MHADDLAELFVLALETAPAGTPFDAVAENVSMRGAAGSVGRALGVEAEGITPEKAGGEWGFFAGPQALWREGREDARVNPFFPSLFEDLERGFYQV